MALPVTSGLILHLDAALGLSLSGSDVTAWADQSGEGNNYNAVGSDYPVWYASPEGMNSNPAVLFDSNAVLQCVSGDLLTNKTGITVFTAARVISVGSRDSTVFSVVDPTTSSKVVQIYGSQTTNRWSSKASNASGTEITAQLGDASFETRIGAHIISSRIGFNAGETRVTDRVSGANSSQGTHSAANSSASIAMTENYIGVSEAADIGAPNDNYFYGLIGEILVYDSVLSDANHQSVADYLYTKYVGGVDVNGSGAGTLSISAAGVGHSDVRTQPEATVLVPVNSDRAVILGSKLDGTTLETYLQITDYKYRTDHQDILQP